MDKPVISFVITSFNQKKYIASALRAAFAQTYSPLEIIVADDHSTDGSDGLIRDLVAEYKAGNGRHVVIYQRNDENLGVLRNCEKSFSLATGELIVLGGGDDISHVDRVSKIAEKWIAADKKPTVVFHGVRLIGNDGEPLAGDFWKPTIRNPLGAAMAFSPVVVKAFPRVTETRGYEDNVFSRRAYALGDPLHIEDKLVDYRFGSGSTSAGAFWDCRKRISSAMVFAAKQNLIDFKSFSGGAIS